MNAVRLPVVLVSVFFLVSTALAEGPAEQSRVTQKLLADSGGTADIRVDPQSGQVKFVRLPTRSAPGVARMSRRAPADDRAKAFFREYGAAFGVEKADENLKTFKTMRDMSGREHAVLRQTFENLPVFGGELRAHFDAAGEMFAANGNYVAGIKIDTTPRLSDQQASEIAIHAVADGATRFAKQPGGARERAYRQGVAATGLSAAATTLMVFREGLVRGTPGQDRLAYEVEVINPAVTVREFVYVDAHNGRVIDQITGIYHALDREISETALANVVWDESVGDPVPIPDGWAAGTAQQVLDWNNEIDGARETYNLFASMSAGSYDSYDNAGSTMRTVNNDPNISCPNANWNGTSTNYCSDVTGDDTVAHEWGHAYTEYTSGLIYQWQSGALNESYSDIWGEVVDLINARGTDDAPGSRRSDGSCSVFGVGVPSVDNAYRWLSGEDDPAFGGAIRDMWNPTCYGDPGKVTDSEYFCSTADSGGVHFNSGVPNHAFALLVDGGNYNGQTVNAIGLTKAAHIHWAAQRLLTPVSNFVDHADALEAACSSLIGTDLPALSTDSANAGLSGEVISAADCAAVTTAIAAVELRTLPSQCGFEPLLEADAPALCENLGAVQPGIFEDFEAGALPAGWTVGRRDVANPATFDTPDWAVTENLPDGANSLFAAFVPDLVVGNCLDDDESGAVFLDSPAINLPLGEVPRLAFDHWVATEAGWDGGNLKVSVNGGPFTVVPGSSYSFNSYNTSLVSVGGGNTNPLAGEEAFSGSDAGSVTGSWGQSQVNLLGQALPGDTVILRFEFGGDGCNGLIGWYVDNVQTYSCSLDELPVCGDGIMGPGEMCDDGNSSGGDGCSSSCQIEAGYRCDSPIPGSAGANMVADGSFEAGAFGGTWNEFSSNFGSPICDVGTCGTGTGSGPSDGLFWTWFGGVATLEEGSVSQAVVIPTTADVMTFDLEQIICDSGADYVEVLIDGNQEFRSDGSDALCGTLGYSQQSVDLSAYADGAAHTIEFHSEVFGTNGAGSNFFVDNVVISDNVATEGLPSRCEAIPLEMACNAGRVSYDDGIPDSWTLVDNENSGLTWTSIANSGELGNYTGGSGDAATVSSDAFGPAEIDTELRSNTFSLKTATAASFNFRANYQNFAALDFLDVDVSTDGGVSWSNLLSWNEDHGGFRSPPGEFVSLDLSPYLGEDEVQLRWRYYDPNTGDWDWYAQIDDVDLACALSGRMTGGGLVRNSWRDYSIHAFTLSCEVDAKHNHMVITWRDGRNLGLFRLTELDSVMCSDRPLIDEGHPEAGFDTIEGSGSGRVNGKPASIRFKLTDAGEPGWRDDRVEYTISGPDGATVSSTLNGGNHQAHRN